MDTDNNLVEEKFFYYTFEGVDKIYKISHKSSSLIPLINEMILNNPNESSSVETCLTFPAILLNDKTREESYQIRREIHDFIERYIAIWKDNIANADYLEIKSHNTNNPSNIIKNQDLELIEEYKQLLLNKTSEEQKKKFSVSSYYEKYYIINSFSYLLNEVHGFLNMEGLAKKLYAYISCMLFGCSLNDLAIVINDEEFTKYIYTTRESNIKEWEDDNLEKIAELTE